MPPLLSVIIPTHKRPQFLPRAIDSALLAAPDGDVEVIVVPNGVDISWREIAKKYQNEPRVIWSAIETAHANAARNHGLELAKGKYIRFLDDDDYLLEEAKEQILLLEKTSAHVCSATIVTVDSNGVKKETLLQPNTPNFLAGILTCKRMHQPTAHVFLRRSVLSVAWNNALPYSQDCDWIIRVAGSNNLLWVKYSGVCGVWVKHSRNRISTLAPLNHRKQIVAELIIKSVADLESANSLSNHIKHHAALGLWELVHQAFFINPFYWHRIASYASSLDTSATPANKAHVINKQFFGVHPILVEWLVMPKRFLQYGIKRLLLKMGLTNFW